VRNEDDGTVLVHGEGPDEGSTRCRVARRGAARRRGIRGRGEKGRSKATSSSRFVASAPASSSPGARRARPHGTCGSSRGMMRSWQCRKGPSMDPAQKRGRKGRGSREVPQRLRGEGGGGRRDSSADAAPTEAGGRLPWREAPNAATRFRSSTARSRGGFAAAHAT